ncbi:MAG: ribosome-binding factor A [bacterium]|nr:ribosome-binding factor A [bacterium]
MNYRSQRVSKLIREELAGIMLREVEFADGALVTITGVDVDAKLERAIVWLSVLFASPEPRRGGLASPKRGGASREKEFDGAERAFAELKKRAGELQYLLMKKINIKPMPRIEFQIDRGLEHAAKIEKKIIDIG